MFQAVEGTGLAFIVYSEAIKNMPLPQLWSVLYFFMLLLLGMGSMLGNVTAIITPLRDFKIMSRMSNELFSGKIRWWRRSSYFLLLCILTEPLPHFSCLSGWVTNTLTVVKSSIYVYCSYKTSFQLSAQS